MKKFTDDEGATMAEYGLLLTGIAAVALVAVFAFGEKVAPLFVVPWPG